MKKTNLVILICAFICAILVVILGVMILYFNQNKLPIGGVSHTIVENEYVFMTIKEGTLTKTGATLILKNNSETDFQYCGDFEIEKMQNGLWHNIAIMLDFVCNSNNLNVGETKEFNLDWKNTYGKLPKGTYRIIKTIYKDYPNDPMNKFNSAVEFTIK